MLPQKLFRISNMIGLCPTHLVLRSPFKLREFQALTSTAPISPNDRLLDFGCGIGAQTIRLASRCKEVIGVDTSAEALSLARNLVQCTRVRSRVQFVCGDLAALRFPAGHFDAVFSFCVMEHLDNLQGILSELGRVTKPGGALHITVDSLGTIEDATVIEKHRREHHVRQYFDAGGLARALTAAQWRPYDIQGLHKGPTAAREFTAWVRAWPNIGRVRELLTAPKLYRTLAQEDLSISEPRGVMLLARAINCSSTQHSGM